MVVVQSEQPSFCQQSPNRANDSQLDGGIAKHFGNITQFYRGHATGNPARQTGLSRLPAAFRSNTMVTSLPSTASASAEKKLDRHYHFDFVRTAGGDRGIGLCACDGRQRLSIKQAASG
jgi:hypothetical protein